MIIYYKNILIIIFPPSFLNQFCSFLESFFYGATHQRLADLVGHFTFEQDNKFMTQEIGEAIAKLWKTTTIRRAYERRAEFWNLDASD
jgi:hypothetical protein